ncbi:hypothetical protein EVAR_11499_1 [Eumeta japonica]|uniref:Uncharacterized protein n=1 Tax=Eumeta variegata TaxID=151549 RepID=A0A4C1TYT1_EUMVA|nr:hypothetical protein EVAR_11499_1 [Eumeta japonica]
MRNESVTYIDDNSLSSEDDPPGRSIAGGRPDEIASVMPEVGSNYSRLVGIPTFSRAVSARLSDNIKFIGSRVPSESGRPAAPKYRGSRTRLLLSLARVPR